jgi:hypothetical protein
MLVDNPQDERYKDGVVFFVYFGVEDAPPNGSHFYVGATIDQAIEHIEEAWDNPKLEWAVIPDQIPGCLDEWVGPVRKARDESGKSVYRAWERLEDGKWKRFSQ